MLSEKEQKAKEDVIDILSKKIVKGLEKDIFMCGHENVLKVMLDGFANLLGKDIRLQSYQHQRKKDNGMEKLATKATEIAESILKDFCDEKGALAVLEIAKVLIETND